MSETLGVQINIPRELSVEWEWWWATNPQEIDLFAVVGKALLETWKENYSDRFVCTVKITLSAQEAVKVKYVKEPHDIASRKV